MPPRDDGSLRVRANDLFECESNAKNEIVRKSYYFRGHLRGLISTIFNKDFEVTEVECVAQGDQACTFNADRTERLTTRLPMRAGV